MEKLSSAATFVEGGVYACDHTCSICLKAFCDSDSSTVATSVLQMLQAASMICISSASLSGAREAPSVPCVGRQSTRRTL
uniref:Uncharacterized protein n=1 Tax=Aegilops tauschii TaxID=37682 RepID=R7WDL1_AEGTA